MTQNEPIKVRLAEREDLPALKEALARLGLDMSTGLGADHGILIVAAQGTRLLAGALAQLEAFTSNARFLAFPIVESTVTPESLSALVTQMRMEANFRGWKRLIAYVPAASPAVASLRDEAFEPYDSVYLRLFISCASALYPEAEDSVIPHPTN